MVISRAGVWLFLACSLGSIPPPPILYYSCGRIVLKVVVKCEFFAMSLQDYPPLMKTYTTMRM